jgi:hypothetical protein
MQVPSFHILHSSIVNLTAFELSDSRLLKPKYLFDEIFRAFVGPAGCEIMHGSVQESIISKSEQTLLPHISHSELRQAWILLWKESSAAMSWTLK